MNALARASTAGAACSPLIDSQSVARPCSKCTVVTVVSASSVSDRLPAAGRFSAASRLPQYLTSAMLAHARAVTVARVMVVLRAGSCVTSDLRDEAVLAEPPPAGDHGVLAARGQRDHGP